MLDTIYIGYDPYEHEAIEVLIKSIYEKASRPLNVVTINQYALRRSGLYKRLSIPVENSAINIDSFDNSPQYTQYTYTRYLIPHLNQYRGMALYLDGSVYLRSDPCILFDRCRNLQSKNNSDYNGQYALWCVKKTQLPKNIDRLAINCCIDEQNRGVMMWNCEHPIHQNLTIDDINTKSSDWLHKLSWLKDSHIGDLDLTWNWLNCYSHENITPNIVRYITNAPWSQGRLSNRYIDRHYAEDWINLYHKYLYAHERLYITTRV